MTQGWMIDKSEILWPEVDESNPRGSMDVTALTPSTTLAYIPPSLRFSLFFKPPFILLLDS
jgi:hypothetical protein